MMVPLHDCSGAVVMYRESSPGGVGVLCKAGSTQTLSQQHTVVAEPIISARFENDNTPVPVDTPLCVRFEDTSWWLRMAPYPSMITQTPYGSETNYRVLVDIETMQLVLQPIFRN